MATAATANAPANATNTAANDDNSGDEPGVTATGAAGAAQADQNIQNGPAAQNTPNTHAAGQTTNQATNQAANQAAAATNAAQLQEANQIAAQQNAPQPNGAAKPWQAKAQGAANASKSGDTSTNSSQASTTNAGTANANDIKQAADARAAGPPPPTTAQIAKPVDASAGAMTAIGAATPQAQQTQTSDAPSVTQNVQVSTPTPNIPALAVEISAKSQSGAKQFDIRLDPPELGRVEVRLSIDATGKASAHLSADQPQTLDLLQKDAPTLTRALRDAGLDVSQNGLNFSLRQQSGDTGAGQGQSRGGNGRSFTLSATSSIDATSASAAYRAPADGRLDIRV